MGAGNDHAEICSALLESPRFTASIDTKNNHQRTALDFAVDFADGCAIPVLRSAGASGPGGTKHLGRRSSLREKLDITEEASLPDLKDLEDEVAPDMGELD